MPVSCPQNSIASWHGVSCIADAQPIEAYEEYLHSPGLKVHAVENHDEALAELVRNIRRKLLGPEVLVGLKKLELPNVDIASAKRISAAALAAVDQGQLGYAIIAARKPNLGEEFTASVCGSDKWWNRLP